MSVKFQPLQSTTLLSTSRLLSRLASFTTKQPQLPQVIQISTAIVTPEDSKSYNSKSEIAKKEYYNKEYEFDDFYYEFNSERNDKEIKKSQDTISFNRLIKGSSLATVLANDENISFPLLNNSFVCLSNSFVQSFALSRCKLVINSMSTAN
eukprot:Awhi_evm1s7080